MKNSSAILAGESTPAANDPTLPGVLADMRSILNDPGKQRVLGLFMVRRVNAALKFELLAQRAICRAQGPSQ